VIRGSGQKSKRPLASPLRPILEGGWSLEISGGWFISLFKAIGGVHRIPHVNEHREIYFCLKIAIIHGLFRDFY